MRRILSALALVSLVMCTQPDTEMVLSEEVLTLSATPTVVSIPQKMRANNKYVSVLLNIREEWSPFAPFQQIVMGDGQKVTLAVAASTDMGRVFAANVFGRSGTLMEARMGAQLAKGAPISEIRLTSSHPLTVDKVVWRDWMPK